MDWKTLLGSAFVEGMTDEEAQAKFSELYMTRSDHEREVEKNKSLIDSYSTQIAENKRKERERMSEEEKKAADIQAKIEQDEAERDSYRIKIEIREQQDAYETMGYPKATARELAEKFVSGEKEDFNSMLKIANEKIATEQRSAWEKEYSVNPPAGNGSGKVDFSKQIAEAQEKGDMVSMASLIRQQNEANAPK